MEHQRARLRPNWQLSLPQRLQRQQPTNNGETHSPESGCVGLGSGSGSLQRNEEQSEACREPGSKPTTRIFTSGGSRAQRHRAALIFSSSSALAEPRSASRPPVNCPPLPPKSRVCASKSRKRQSVLALAGALTRRFYSTVTEALGSLPSSFIVVFSLTVTDLFGEGNGWDGSAAPPGMINSAFQPANPDTVYQNKHKLSSCLQPESLTSLFLGFPLFCFCLWCSRAPGRESRRRSQVSTSSSMLS